MEYSYKRLITCMELTILDSQYYKYGTIIANHNYECTCEIAIIIVEPPNKKHIGTSHFVHHREGCPILGGLII